MIDQSSLRGGARAGTRRAAALAACVSMILGGCGSPLAPSSSDTVEGDTITIPFLAGATGPAAPLAKDVRIPAEIVVDKANASGNPKLMKISVDYIDDQLDPKQAVTEFQNIQRSNPILIVGSFSSTSAAVAPLANKAEIPFIAGFSSVTSIASDNRPWTFTTTPELADILGEGVKGWFAQEPDVKRVVLIRDVKDLAARSQAQNVSDGITAAGGEVVGTVDFQTGETDFAAIVNKVRSYNADGIAIGALPTDGGAILRELKRQGVTASRFLTQSVIGAGFSEAVGDAADGAYSSLFFSNADPAPAVREYVAEFKKRSGGLAPSFALSLDTWNVVVKALEMADVHGKTVTEAREAVRKALETLTVDNVAGGTLSFNEQGYMPHPSILVRLDEKATPIKVT